MIHSHLRFKTRAYMKTILLRLLFILSTTFISVSSFAIQNGSLLDTHQQKIFSGTVRIKFGTMLAGSATYLGRGYFLTAAHNLLVAGPDYNGFSISILSNEQYLLDSVDSDSYKIILPPSKESAIFDTSFGAKVKIPLPDLMLIQINSEHLSKISTLQPLAIDRHLPLINENYVIIGSGGSNFENNGTDGKMRIGNVRT